MRNKFFSKALCYRAIFTKMKFYNVNFKGAILTHCSFKNSIFYRVEFLGTNLKKSNFSNAKFQNCIFSATLLKNTNFTNADFKNCIFININITNAKNMRIDPKNNIFLSTHSMPFIDEELTTLLNTFRFHPKLHNYRVLHLKNGKLNSLTIRIILSHFTIDEFKFKLQSLETKLNSRIITAYQLLDLLKD